MSGNFLSGSKGVKDPLKVPEYRCALPRDHSSEMDLISTGGENLLDFPGLGEVLSSYEWDIKYGISLPQERPVPMRVTMGPLGIPLKTIPGPKTFCGVGVRASGVLSSADMDLGVLLESPQGRLQK